ncbi:putative E7 protein [Canis familiaris papillomavirus 13]|uniref:Protein E7 n=1 Tax=Canis familiaris papillomavirus 13 TaxID=1226723 RepID=J7JIX2_9PAPI|nr:putative E7 protein [Canis familiaris papillomavirus 13]AFQ52498.1 putative E7 protein [Canis familiaris papillomavirus 13]
MRGLAPTNRDLDLELGELVLPENLLSSERLDTEEEESEPDPQHYRVVTNCGRCHSTLRVFVAVLSVFQLRTFEQLLLDGFTIVCLRCSQQQSHGRH